MKNEQTSELLFAILNAHKLKNLHRRQIKPDKSGAANGNN